MRAVELLARGVPTEAVGRDIGVTGRTVRRWLDDPAFAEEVQDARRTALTETLRALEVTARSAVAYLAATIRDVNAPEPVRVRAALGILAALPRIAEHVELEERLAILEAAAACVDGAQR
ncbi:hypothetical protein OG982_06105 [Streptomyces sp. NBC_01551]|uniref:helix-turn-helix domain-containing protein n=1 Tax=Streptomyces sp. NBC_01551 TaxID=2975876 RepID=UPI002259AB1D|nr:helix-turn-helix domain-containing protein [Streptomyces sp. NBC_01551]MCX4525266.1 hypothetical protein [Streptomyces sp. NBC_01551]